MEADENCLNRMPPRIVGENSQPDDTEVIRTKSKAETQVLVDIIRGKTKHKYIDKYKFKYKYIMQRLRLVLYADGEYKSTIRGKTQGSYANVNKGLLSTKCQFIENTNKSMFIRV